MQILKNYSPILLITLLTIIFSLSTSALAQDSQTYRLAVSDITGLEELQREFKAFQDELKKQSGLNIELFPVSSRTAVVEALKFKKVDFVLTGPAEYVVISKKSQAEPLVAFSRPDYYSAIIVKSDSDFFEIPDLKGKKVALGDVGSTSYYLAPMQLLMDGGINPKSDVQTRVVSKQIAWTALKRGDVDALGFSYERFVQYRDEDKLASSDFRIIARSGDLPNDVLIVGAHVPMEIRSKLKNAFVNGSDILINELLKGSRNNKYENMRFLPNIGDKNYDIVRKMYRTAGFPEFG